MGEEEKRNGSQLQSHDGPMGAFRPIGVWLTFCDSYQHVEICSLLVRLSYIGSKFKCSNVEQTGSVQFRSVL